MIRFQSHLLSASRCSSSPIRGVGCVLNAGNVMPPAKAGALMTTGNPAESFETTVWRYAAQPWAQQNFSNVRRALTAFMLAPMWHVSSAQVVPLAAARAG